MRDHQPRQILRIGDVKALKWDAADRNVDLNRHFDRAAVRANLQAGEVTAGARQAFGVDRDVNRLLHPRPHTIRIGPEPLAAVGHDEVANQDAVAAVDNRQELRVSLRRGRRPARAIFAASHRAPAPPSRATAAFRENSAGPTRHPARPAERGGPGRRGCCRRRIGRNRGGPGRCVLPSIRRDSPRPIRPTFGRHGPKGIAIRAGNTLRAANARYRAARRRCGKTTHPADWHVRSVDNDAQLFLTEVCISRQVGPASRGGPGGATELAACRIAGAA